MTNLSAYELLLEDNVRGRRAHDMSSAQKLTNTNEARHSVAYKLENFVCAKLDACMVSRPGNENSLRASQGLCLQVAREHSPDAYIVAGFNSEELTIKLAPKYAKGHPRKLLHSFDELALTKTH